MRDRRTETSYGLAEGGDVSSGPRVLPADRNSRLNDATCDWAGRLLVGSLALGDSAGDELLVRIEPSGAVTVIDDDLQLSNGLAFSPDGRSLYSVDTGPGIVWVCVDADGNLWIAIWGAGQVRVFTPDGVHLGDVEVGAPNVSSVAFIGPDLDTLLITTAADPADEVRSLDSGRLFTARVGVPGLPIAPWAGPEPIAYALS